MATPSGPFPRAGVPEGRLGRAGPASFSASSRWHSRPWRCRRRALAECRTSWRGTKCLRRDPAASAEMTAGRGSWIRPAAPDLGGGGSPGPHSFLRFDLRRLQTLGGDASPPSPFPLPLRHGLSPHGAQGRCPHPLTSASHTQPVAETFKPVLGNAGHTCVCCLPLAEVLGAAEGGGRRGQGEQGVSRRARVFWKRTRCCQPASRRPRRIPVASRSGHPGSRDPQFLELP